MERSQRTGCPGGVPGRLDQQPRTGPGPCLLMRPCLAGSLSGLLHPRAQTEIADEMLRSREPSHVTDRGQHRGRSDAADPGQRHQPADVLTAENLLSDLDIDELDLAVEKIDLPHASVNGLLLIDRQHPALVRKPDAPFDPKGGICLTQ